MLRVRPNDEITADALWALGAIAVTERGDALEAGFADDDAEADAFDELRERLVVERVADDIDAWADTWRDHAQPVRVGRVVLQPAWFDGVQHDDDVAVRIDPGRAFGVGAHPTTRLAAAALLDEVGPGDDVLDVGTGTGVLAIVAAVAGARQVTAIDIDPHAVEIASANAVRNGCHDRVEVRHATVDAIDGTYDVVVANLGGLLVPVEIAPALASRATRSVIVSGLLDPTNGGPDPQPLDDRMATHGFDVRGTSSLDGWMVRRYVSRAGTRARRGRGSPERTG